MNLHVKEIQLFQKLSMLLGFVVGISPTWPFFPSISEISYICAMLSFLRKLQQFQSIIVLNWENSIFSNV